MHILLEKTLCFILGASLNDVNILASDWIPNLHHSLPVGLVVDSTAARLDAQSVADEVRQLRVRITAEQHDVGGDRHVHVALCRRYAEASQSGNRNETHGNQRDNLLGAAGRCGPDEHLAFLVNISAD